ncbi:TMV resistance protein N [Vitis vinifera]|uniref:TMV resistance protein N n=1 Tax=Vitis vinifera TaxID=29760 RepID=A0A438GFT9_VITVI|nr:TMV resistance protein N [Vitis vinifera]
MNLLLEKLKSLIEVESNDVRMVGIYGIGGIGKTTMSKAIYNEILTKFEGISFLENVREKSKDDSSLVQSQQQLNNSILKRKNPTISNGHEGIHVIRKRLQTKRLLVVLDDVDKLKQLENLAGKHDWFGPRSRIIITSRDQHLLNVHGVDALHEVKELNQKEATQLFSQHAFQKDLREEHYVELSKRVVDYTKGCMIYYNKWVGKLFAKSILESLENGADYGNLIKSMMYYEEKWDYKVLLPKNFEFPSYEMRYFYWDAYPLKFLPSHFDGENLVELNLQSSNIKQIWKGNKCLQALKVVDLSHSKKLIKVSNFSCMKNLETLILEGCTSLHCVDQSIGVLKKLTLLSLKGSKRLKSLPSTVECLESLDTLYLSSCSNLEIFPEIKRNMKRLLRLELGGTAIKELPSSVDHLTALQYLDLPECKNLESIPCSICRLKSLVNLNLNGCSNLELPSSIENLVDLRLLVPDNCKNLATLPNSLYYLRHLTTPRLANCSRLHKHPEKWNLESLGSIGSQLASLKISLRGTNIRSISVVITQLSNLEFLDMSHCKMLEEIQGLPPSPREINAYGCTGLKSLIHSQIQSLDMEKYLEMESSSMQGYLCLNKTGAIEEFPSSMDHLTRLQKLGMRVCQNLKSLPSNTGRLKFLEELYVSDHSNLETSLESQRTENIKGLKLDLPSLKWLEHLFLMDGTVANNLWCLSSLECLDLSETSIHRIPAGITECCNLKHLIIRHCKKLKEIPKLPSSLLSIDAYGCTGPGTLSTPSSLLWSSLLKWFKKVQPPLKRYRNDCREISLGKEDMEYFWFNSGSRLCMIDGSALDGLWAGYYPKMAMLDMFHSKQYVHLQASFVYQGYGRCCNNMESCGIHLIYSKDHQHNHTPLGFS